MENAERASRIRVEISKQTKEDKHFVHNVEKAKRLKSIQSKAVGKGDIFAIAALA